MLEQARQQGAAAAQDFIDDPTNALPLVPFSTESSTSSLLGVDVGLARWAGSIPRERKLGLGLVGQLRHSKLEQPRQVGLWGQSWTVKLDAELGAQADGYFVSGSAAAQFGTLVTLSNAGHAAYLRFSGDISIFGDTKYSMGTGLASIPFGMRLILAGAVFELGAVPGLGWTNIFEDSRHVGSGPLFFGGQARWQTQAGWLELQQMHGVSPADVVDTRVSACGHYKNWLLCADGSWLDLHDIGNGDEVRFARVGLRLGVGSWNLDTTQSLRTSLVPLR